MQNKVILITGASSGFGQATAQLLSEKGLIVYGTSRDPSQKGKDYDYTLLPLDVRSDESVNNCFEELMQNEKRIDVLINNAGYELAGSIEETSLVEAKDVFETNLYGTIRMVKAVLPIMRKQGSGAIVNVSSLAGIVPVPFMGIYSASKFAVEGYTEALRHEVKPFGIRVSLIEAGFSRTNIATNRQYAAAPISDYDLFRQRAFESYEIYEEKGLKPSELGEGILKVISRKSPRLRNRIGKEAVFISRGRRFAPETIFEKVGRKYFKLDG